MLVSYDSGIYLPEIDLSIDPVVRRQHAVVSHAHADHVRRHGTTLATPATARLIAHRYHPRGQFIETPFGCRRDYTSYSLTLFPAGHVLGSAQVLVERGGDRLLYSGDFKLRPSATAEAAEIPEAETLVVEATFGHPRYRFPDSAGVVAEIIAFCRQALSDGVTPVLLAYSLGKGQELLAHIAGAGLHVALHEAAHGVSEVYQSLGVSLPPYGALCAGGVDGRVVICPSGSRQALPSLGAPRTRTAYISGWAVDRSARFRARADAAFCLSDHADYDELITYVQRVNPRRVFTVHGFAGPFAADLRALGYDARPLKDAMQYRLL